MISPIILCQLSIGNQNVNIPKFPQKYITLKICTPGVHTCLASPFTSVTGNKGTVWKILSILVFYDINKVGY